MELFDQSAELVNEISSLRTINYNHRNDTVLTEPVKLLTMRFGKNFPLRCLNGFCLYSVTYKVQSSIIEVFFECGKWFHVMRRYWIWQTNWVWKEENGHLLYVTAIYMYIYIYAIYIDVDIHRYRYMYRYIDR